MATDMNNVREKLDRIAGVQPSQHWLQDCWTELGVTGAANCTADAVLQQILHHDLRDVVREFPPALQTNDANHPSFLLRRALQDSMSAQHNYKSELPPSFRLLVQVEELLDVSQNAETRLSVGPASPNAPAPVGNQQARCLKLCLSDGYEPAASNNSHENYINNNNNNNPNNYHDNGNENGMTFRQPGQSSVFMAMEVEPIPALSVNSKAGVKVVMRGPLQIRHGLLLWQPVYRVPDNTGAGTGGGNGNANAVNAATAVQQITVLGGCVAELVQIQATALQQAKLVAGVGVDPTVRALIWNPETGETQEDDEGEQESRDLEPGGPPPPPVQQRQPARPLQPLVPPNMGTGANPPRQPPPRSTPVTSAPPLPRQTTTPVTSAPRRPQHQQPAASASTRNPYAAATSSTTSTSAPNNRNPYQSNASSNPSNPYQSSNSSMNGSSQNSREAATGTVRMRPVPRLQQQQQQQQQPSNRYDNDIEDIVMEDSDPVSMDTTPLAARGSSSRPVGMPPPAASMHTPASNMAGAANGTSGGGGGGGMSRLQALSFVELRNRLARARESEELYRQMYGQSFVVQARQHGTKLEFNIERIKSSANESKKVKRYGYYMSARFKDGTVNGDLISCKISNAILEPHFSLPPIEMRKINREDRKRSEELIRDGGKQVQAALLQPRSYETTLLLSPDEFFRSESNPMPPLDGTIPILHLVKHCE